MPFRRLPGTAAAGDAIPFTAPDGRTHLFFLSSPPDTLDYPERVRTSWQHISTSDLDAWATHPTAVHPGPPGAIDAGGIWTGSVVHHDGTYWLFYTGHDPASANPQSICLATSTDLDNFERHAANPLILPTAGNEDVDWRDPYVFYNETERRWWMLIAARRSVGPRWRRGVIMLATSEDLVNWVVEPEPLYAPDSTYCPECPELWPMNGRWYLVYSRFSEDVGTIYRVAETPRGPFRTPENDHLGDRRWYAAKSAPSGPDTRTFFGWVHDKVDEGGRPRWLWGGDFALPRRVTADENGNLLVQPVLPKAWVSAGRVDVTTTVGGPGRSQTQTLISEMTPTLLLEANLDSSSAAEISLNLLDNDDYGYCVILRPHRKVAEIRVAPEHMDDFWADLTAQKARYREVDGPVLARADLPQRGTHWRVTVALDGDLLEVYVNDQVALTTRVSRSASQRLDIISFDGPTTVSASIAALA